MTNQSTANQLMDIALRIRDMREILGYSMQKMAELTEVSDEMYKLYESGTEHIMLAHLSEENNLPELAFNEVFTAIADESFDLKVARQDAPVWLVGE